jgi:chloride channel protein, CIC family
MRGIREAGRRALAALRQWARHDTLVLSILAMIVGVATGGAVILFREGIGLVQTLFYGSGTERLWQHADAMAWWRLLVTPAVGGLIVGLMIHYLMTGRRPHAVADAIEASALNAGRMSPKDGIWAAIISAISIGCGASVGREGPAVHLGAMLGSWAGQRLQLTPTLTRTLLGCGVASAVAASFNAPIAGALFANEVIIGHYALSAFAPVVIASVLGTVVSRAHFGNFPAFAIPEHELISFWEFPAIIGLGVLAGVSAILFVRAVKLAREVADRTPGPTWIRPAIGGLMVGMIAMPVPHVLGIGYGVTEAALTVSLPFQVLAVVCVAKLIATAISLGFGFGGGVFSPSLVIGATLGAAYGIIFTGIFPEYSAGAGAYTVIGTGAMAAAVLGAPISTTLIVFEMTGDYQLTLGVMLAVVVGAAIFRPLQGQSFFTWQLEQRGLDLDGGFEAALLRGIPVSQVMTCRCEVIGPDVGLRDLRVMLQYSNAGQFFVVGSEGELIGTLTLSDLREAAYDPSFDERIKAEDVTQSEPPMLSVNDDLDTALKLTRTSGLRHVAVVEDPETRIFAGCLYERDAMSAYNRALLDNRREERG